MADETNSSVADFLNTISPTEEIFKEEPSEDTESDVAEEPQERVSYAKDEKLQRFIDKQVEKRLARYKPTVETQFVQEVKDELNLPASFIKLVGNDTDEKKQVLKDLSQYFGTLKGDAKKEAWEEMQQRAQEVEQQQIAEDNAAVEELQEGFESIEETFNVDLTSSTPAAQKLDADFRAYIRKVAHKNENGEVDSFPDLVGTFEEFMERRKAPASRAKQLASRGMTRSTETSEGIPKFSSNSRDPWKQVDNFFDKLKSNN